ncbi:MAG: manganese efflux pump MntP family protein [Candidatus Dormibacteraeota bacterium]|nr:manganese efflux pump MntP family protein [Candidatus Dormibacteraeota bacterium]
MNLKLVGLIVPLGLDTFAVAAALGISGLRRQDRLRVSLLFTGFEMGMPLVGFFGGRLAGNVVGNAADYLAIAILIGLGFVLLRPGNEEAERARLGLLARTRGFAALGLGISISLDELAIGFTLGLLRLPVLVVILLIGVQTFIVTQLGLALGARIGERIREGAGRVAGVALAVLGVILLLEKLRP